MHRVSVLAAVLLAVGVTGALAFDLFRDRGSAAPEAGTEGAPASVGEADAVLVGRGDVPPTDAPVDPPADEEDVHVLLRRVWRSRLAQERLLDLARVDPAVPAALVEWLGPAHDHERMPPEPPGQRTSGSGGSPALAALADTLVRLAPASLPPLVAALDDEDPVLRERVAEILGRLPAHAAVVVPALLARLEKDRDDEEDVGAQVTVLRALGALGDAAAGASDVFLAYVRDDAYADDARAAAAEGLLAVVGPTPAALEAASRALRDQSFEVCTRLIPDLEGLGAEAVSLAPDLLGIVLDPTANDGVQQFALEALGHVAAGEEAVGDALLAVAFDDREVNALRAAALRSLARLGRAAQADLLRRLGRADAETRCLAVEWLAHEGTVPAASLLALLDPLRDASDRDVRGRALHAGSRVDGPPDVRVAWLARWVGDDDTRLCRQALSQVARMPDETGRVVELLVGFLDDEDPELRDVALEGLLWRNEFYRGDAAAQRRTAVIDAVRRRLEDPLPVLRGRAATWIACVAPTYDEEALPVWIEQLASGSWTLDLHPVLERLGPKARAALPALEAARTRAGADGPLGARLGRTIDAIRGR